MTYLRDLRESRLTAKPFLVLFFLPVFFLLFAWGAWGAEPAASKPKGAIYVATLDGIVGVPMEEHLREVLAAAREEGAYVLILKIDTPGGLVSSMSAMTAAIGGAPFPVVAWVGPHGAEAASAGAFLVMSAHVAAMSSQSHIGAAHPVTIDGKDTENKEMSRKVVNDLTARMRSLAQERGRNVAVAASMVTDSVSLTSKEALNKKIIDFIANDIPEVVSKLHGRRVKMPTGTLTLDTAGASIKELSISPRLQLLGIIARPDVIYFAMLAGLILLALEFKNPGGMVMGISGALLLMLAAFGLRILPVNFAGVALLVAGVGVMVADLFIGGGILALLGVAAIVIGGLILFRTPGAEMLRVSLWTTASVGIVLGGIFLVVLRAIHKTFRSKPQGGLESLAGEEGTVVEPLAPAGMITLRGELWRARTADGDRVEAGERVRVIRAEGLSVVVEFIKES